MVLRHAKQYESKVFGYLGKLEGFTYTAKTTTQSIKLTCHCDVLVCCSTLSLAYARDIDCLLLSKWIAFLRTVHFDLKPNVSHN